MEDRRSAEITSVEEFKRGWKIVLLAGIGLACGLGAIPIYTSGVLTAKLTVEFSWSKAEVQGIYSWFTLGNLIAAPILGWMVDKRGVRNITLFSIIGMALGMASLGLFTGPLWTFYLIAFLTAIVGVGTVPITWTRLIVDWFDVSRGKALGIALAGTGVSATFLPVYATWLITEFGWRFTYLGLAALPAFIAFPLAYFFLWDRRENIDTGNNNEIKDNFMQKGLKVTEVLYGYRYWVINLAFVIIGLSIAGLISNFVLMLIDRDISLIDGAKIAGVIGPSVIAGRLITGYLVDRFWAPGVALVLLSLPAISCLILATGFGGVGAAMFAAILIGLAAGAEFDLMSFLVSRYFGQRNYGLIYSFLYAVFKISAGIGAPLFGYVKDTYNTYDPILFLSSGLLIGGSMLLLTLGRYRYSN